MLLVVCAECIIFRGHDKKLWFSKECGRLSLVVHYLFVLIPSRKLCVGNKDSGLK